MSTFTYRVSGEENISVRINARTALEASRTASAFAMKKHLLLIGPAELARQPIYLDPKGEAR